VRTSVMAAIAAIIPAIDPIPRFPCILASLDCSPPIGVRPGEKSPSRTAGLERKGQALR